MALLKIIITLVLMGTSSLPILPDLGKTPGAVNNAVTQQNIRTTICVSGYTAKIRPSSSYTTLLKIKQLATGYAFNGDKDPSHYEEDHLISLELGGAPKDVANLWPEPYAGTTGARIKDQVENKLHDLVCAGKLSLSLAQQAIASNWWDAYNLYVLGKQATPTPTPTPSVSATKSASPSPSATQSPVVRTSPTPSAPAKALDPRFATCSAANAAGYGPYFKAVNPEYYWYRDANNDGKVC